MKHGFPVMLLFASGTILLSSCATAPPAGPAERAGREIDRSLSLAAAETGDALETAGRETSAALDTASRATNSALNKASVNVSEFLERTGRNLQQGTFW